MEPMRGFPRIANIYGAQLKPTSTDVELRLLARYGLLIGGVSTPSDREGREQLNARIVRLRELNPEIIITVFSGSSPYWGEGATFSPPEEAFLHDVHGQRINGWPGTQMLNLSRPESIAALVRQITDRIAGIAVDGIFVDCMDGWFDRWAVEIESGKAVQVDADGDGVEDSPAALDAAWIAGKTALLATLRAALGSQRVIMVNGQGDATYARGLINGNYLEDNVDFALVRNWEIERVLAKYLAWTQLPYQPNCTTINATPNYWPPYLAWERLSAAENSELLTKGYGQLQPMRFGLALALMGDGYYSYDLNTRWRGQHWWYAEYDAPLGRAQGPAAAYGDGTWRREFENGLVVLNARPQQAHVRFNRAYRDYTTGWAGQEAAIPAYDGRIYFPVGLDKSWY
jgi:hypothetical protein